MIFSFSDYRSYLLAYLASLPKQGYGEATKMAAHLGVSSTFISQVLSGAKVLTPEQAHLLGDYLGLSGPEADYFFYLVQHERAGNHQLKKYCEKKLNAIKAESLKLSERLSYKRVLSEEDRVVFYSNALYSAIHLYTSTADSGRTLDEIAKRFDVPKARASEIIGFLVETGFCVETDGRYTMGTQSTHLPAGSPHLLKHHANWRLRALQASEVLSDEELMYTVNVSLSKADYAKLREEMVSFIESFLQTVYPSPAEEIACFNLDFFWIRK